VEDENSDRPSAAMFMGSRVDGALTFYYRRILDHGDQPTVGQVI
jgi:hypothetical protein